MKKVFPGARGEWSLALLAVGSTALAACHSQSATYRPAPRYATSPPTTTAPGYRCGASAPMYPTTPPPNYGQPAYGQPAYGQPSYGQPAYGQPSYTPPPGTTTTPPPPPPPRGGQMSCGKGKCG